jgi:outer membrane protein OmpA-like peptidoglycan-associated protein
VLSDDKVKFGFDQANLSDDARAALDAFAAQLKTENRNVYVEIQGHTDNVGGESYNEKLGAQRAAAVKEYLAKQGIPLFRMETISYGEAAPVADNGSREGRAQNRRVVLVVLQ